LFSYLSSLWDKIIGVFRPAPDTRPDPEDPVVYAHLEKLLQSFDDAKAPFQLLRDTSKRPTDVAKGWSDVKESGKTSVLATPLGYSCWVDVYDGPSGKGLVVNYEVDRKGVKFHKAVNVGPEQYREQDWTEVVSIPMKEEL
jgi:hypothetical protein